MPDVTGRARQPTRKRKGTRNWFSKISSDRAAKKKKIAPANPPGLRSPGRPAFGSRSPGRPTRPVFAPGGGCWAACPPGFGAPRGNARFLGVCRIPVYICRTVQDSSGVLRVPPDSLSLDRRIPQVSRGPQANPQDSLQDVPRFLLFSSALLRAPPHPIDTWRFLSPQESSFGVPPGGPQGSFRVSWDSAGPHKVRSDFAGSSNSS